MKNSRKFTSLFTAIIALTLVGCNPTTTSSVSTSSTNESTNSSESNNSSEDTTTSSEAESSSSEESSESPVSSSSEETSDSSSTSETPVTETALLTLNTTSPLTFADGSKSKEFEVGSSLTADDFAGTLADGRTLAGFGIYSETTGTTTTYDLASFKVPETDTTLIPYFSAKAGYTSLEEATIDYTGTTGTFAEKQDATLTSSVLVKGGTDGYLEKGFTFTEASAVEDLSSVALNLSSSLITEEAVYEFNYSIDNLSSSELHLNLYQVNSETDYADGSTTYASGYRIDIDLAAGESYRTSGQWKLTTNTLAKMYLVADEAMASGVSFSFSASLKKTDLTDPETVASAEKATITLSLPEGVTVADTYATEGDVGSAIVVPTTDEITNTLDSEIAGWYDVDSGETITSTTILPRHGITIAPFFNAPTGYTTLELGSGKSGRFNFDTVPGSITANQTITGVVNQAIAGDEGSLPRNGMKITETSAVTAYSAFRLDSSASSVLVDDSAVYSTLMNVTNYGTEAIHFNYYSLTASSKYKTSPAYEDDTYRLDIDLEPGESKTYTYLSTIAKNNNVLNYFVADASMDNGFTMGVSFALEQITDGTADELPAKEAQTDVTLEYVLPEGMTATESTPTSVQSRTYLEEPDSANFTNTTGRTIGGWYLVDDPNQSTIGDNPIAAYGTSMRIAPYFSTDESGNSYLTPCSGKDPAYPDYFGTVDSEYSFTSQSGYSNKNYSTVFNAYYTRYVNNQALKVFSAKEAMPDAAAFRMLTSYSVASGSSYTFTYTLHNYGTSDLSLELRQIQGGTTLTGDNVAISDTITLKASETTAVTLNFTSSNNNGNIMTFVINHGEAAYFALGIGMGAALNA